MIKKVFKWDFKKRFMARTERLDYMIDEMYYVNGPSGEGLLRIDFICGAETSMTRELERSHYNSAIAETSIAKNLTLPLVEWDGTEEGFQNIRGRIINKFLSKKEIEKFDAEKKVSGPRGPKRNMYEI